ncbi:MAG: hypothetical protein WBW72_23025, partial [Erwinia billingiae]
ESTFLNVAGKLCLTWQNYPCHHIFNARFSLADLAQLQVCSVPEADVVASLKFDGYALELLW